MAANTGSTWHSVTFFFKFDDLDGIRKRYGYLNESETKVVFAEL